MQEAILKARKEAEAEGNVLTGASCSLLQLPLHCLFVSALVLNTLIFNLKLSNAKKRKQRLQLLLLPYSARQLAPPVRKILE